MVVVLIIEPVAVDILAVTDVVMIDTLVPVLNAAM